MPTSACVRRAAGGLGLGLLTAGLVALPVTAAANPGGTNVVINEAYGGGGNTGAPYRNDFIELYNPTNAAIPVGGCVVEYFSGTGGSGGTTTLKAGGSVPAKGYYLIQQAAGASTTAPLLPTPDDTGNLSMAAANGSVEIRCAEAVVDLVGYGTATRREGTAAPAGTNSTSLSRTPVGADTDNNSADFTAGAPTPQNAGPVAPPQEPPPATDRTIAEIQGPGPTSPLVGQNVATEGVVTAVYPAGGFNGFNIQTAGTGGSAPDTTAASDGIFVYGGTSGFASYPAIGDSVRVTGTVAEFTSGGASLTQLTSASFTQRPTALAPVQPLTGPWFTTNDEREAHEGELFDPTDALTVTNSYATWQFGDIGLATGTTPLRQPTEYEDAQTGNPAAIAADNARRLVTLDDGKSQNFASSASGEPLSWLDATHPVRVGAAATLKGAFVVDHRNGLYKLQPRSPVNGLGTEVAEFENTRLQNLAPANVGGDIRVATFNVLNYFPTTGEEYVQWGLGTCSYFNDRQGNPVTVNSCSNNGPRGAAQEDDFQRQQAKIVAAINKLGASVVGLEEIENSVQFGLDRDDAVSKLVDALNAAAGAGTWDYVRSPAAADRPTPAEEDVIRTAFIFKPANVKPVGVSRILRDEVNFDNAREPLAQAFKVAGTADGQGFGVIVNHFKSKGSACATGNDPVQGNCNADRIGQAVALADFANAFANDRGIKAVFLTGDFNSYTEEDPIQELESRGFQLVKSNQANDDSYSFQGLSGSLDHVLANAAAKAMVTGADIWEINADESLGYQYNRHNYNITNLYTADHFASSDHNPEIFGVKVATPTPVTPPPPNAVVPDVTVSVTPDPIIVDRTRAVVRAKVTVGGSNAKNGTVEVSFRGRLLGTAPVVDGVATVTLPRFRDRSTDLDGEYDRLHVLDVSYVDGSGVSYASQEVTVRVRKAISDIRVLRAGGVAGKMAVLRIKVRDLDAASGIARGFARIKFNREWHSMKLVDGKATWKLGRLAAQTRKVVVRYNGNNSTATDRQVAKLRITRG